MSMVESLFIQDNLSKNRKLIAKICEQSPMFDVITNKVNKRYLEDSNGHWLADFATQSYLDFDFDKKVIKAAIKGTREFGTVVAWCRLVATVNLFTGVEKKNCSIDRVRSL